MANNTITLRDQLKQKLREIFQFEKEDLDFGIYRIINYKQKEIEKFIERDLLEKITSELNLLTEQERRIVEDELNQISSKDTVKKYIQAVEQNDITRIEIYKKDFKDDIEQYENLKKQLDQIRVSEDLEKEIYNHLINFFSRYYEEGDFISKKRFGRNEKYVVPYNGEEVVLYWANKDQYYIKTTDYFTKYSFKVKDYLTVNFKVILAEEEKGNIKAQEKKFFILSGEKFKYDDGNKVLDIFFEFRSLTDEEKEKYKYGNSPSQDKINEEIINILNSEIPNDSPARLIFEEKDGKTLIERHLYRYTRRNTTDYFIHKDLKNFLERELDFYIKNEFLKLEDLQVLEESGYFDKLRLYLIGVRAFRKIAQKIIEFLSQIENFQKKLWEKKKFVVETNYVITLDKIKEYAGDEFLEKITDEILGNEKQLNEWKELFGVEVKGKDDLLIKNELLEKKWKKLPLDTKYFSDDFKWNLICAISKDKNLDDILDGILIKSENFHALNLLLEKYKEKVQTIYIDPPFNKEQEADYLYKVGYKDSTWITMLENRIKLARDLLNERGSIFVRCDYNGNMYVRLLMNEIFGEENFRNEIQVKRMTKLAGTTGSLDVANDSLFLFSKSMSILIRSIQRDRICKYCKQPKKPEWVPLEAPGEGKNDLVIINGKKFYARKNSHWTFKQEVVDELFKKGLLRINESRSYVDKFGNRVHGLPEYLQYPFQEIDNDWTDIPGYSREWDFQTENSEILLKRVIQSTSNEGDLIMDFFLGSGTTTAVAHKLKRKWIGVEMGEHFWTVVLPRMKKVLFYDKSGISKENDVKEKYNEKTAGGFFKYHTLEQYEDALENIEFQQGSEEQQNLLMQLPDYFVKYMLEWETKSSSTFLNLEKLKDPFNYQLNIIENYQQKKINVDVIETFNYLIGLFVNRYKVVNDNGRKYIFVFGERNGKKCLVVWRNIENLDYNRDKEIIENNLNSFKPDEIYINGDAVISDFKPIEPLFKSLIFEG